MMRQFFLIRHGQSLANTKNTRLGDNYVFDGDIPLTEDGIKECHETGKFLEKYFKENSINKEDVVVWVSPFLRTEETARIINSYLNIKKVYYDPRISEMDFGLFDQRDPVDCNNIDKNIYEQIGIRSKSKRGKFYAKRPNGESPLDVYTRMSTFVDTLYRDNNKINIIVSHGISLRVFTMRTLHYDLEWYYNEDNADNASVRLICGEPLEDKGYIHKGSSEVIDHVYLS